MLASLTAHLNTTWTATRFILTRNLTKPANISATNSIMKDGKGACKSNDITATPIREAQTTSGKQQSKCEQELPKKPRSAMKKDLTAFFCEGKRSPGPTTSGNPIVMVIQCRKLQRGTPTGKEDNGAGAGGKKDNNNGWRTPLVKKKRDKSNTTPQDAKGKEGQNNKKPRSDDEESAGEQ